MVQVFITNKMHGDIDKTLEELISQDVKARVENISENNFTVDRIDVILSFYAPPSVQVFVSEIRDRSIFHHRQNGHFGFHIVHPLTYLDYFYRFVIEEADVPSE